MDRTGYRAALVEAGLGGYADALVGAARPGIRLGTDPSFGADRVDSDRAGASRLGRDPDLPPGDEWPRKAGAPRSGRRRLAAVAPGRLGRRGGPDVGRPRAHLLLDP